MLRNDMAKKSAQVLWKMITVYNAVLGLWIHQNQSS